jgi:hypothetical protein
MEKYNLKIINLFEKIDLLPALPNAMDKGVLERLMILHEYFNRSYKAICVLKECHASLVAEVLEYLNTPRDKRPYTDSQIMDPHFEEGGELVVLLRKLGAIYKNGLLKV